MLEGEIEVIGEAMMDVALNGRDQTRIGNRHQSIAPHGVYPCKDEDAWVTIVAADDRQWEALCRAMAREDLIRDNRFADPLSRSQNQEELDRIIAEWTHDKDKSAVQTALQAHGVSAMAALAVDELFDDPHLSARELFHFVDHPESGPFPHTRSAFTLSESPTAVERSGPLLAEHNQHVLHDLLGIDGDTSSRLLEEDITGTP
jgi:crotonobetainyl-CoA:carnitine CoA-transferase CaiB-like acyl-CoA transferase